MNKLPLKKMSDGIYTLPESLNFKSKVYISSDDENLKGNLAAIFGIIKLSSTSTRPEYFYSEQIGEIDKEIKIEEKLKDCTHFISILSNKCSEKCYDYENSALYDLMNIELEIAIRWGGKILCFVPKNTSLEKLYFTFKEKISNPMAYNDINDLAAKTLSEMYLERMMQKHMLSDSEESELGLYKYLVNNFETLEPRTRDDLLISLSKKEAIAPGIAQLLSVYLDLLNQETKEILINNMLKYESASKFLPWVLAEKNNQISENLMKKIIYKLIGDR